MLRFSLGRPFRLWSTSSAGSSKVGPTMKSLLVLIGGGERDRVVLRTALSAARPLSGHLDCLHIHVTPGEAARDSAAAFAMGPALRDALEGLQTKAQTFSN